MHPQRHAFHPVLAHWFAAQFGTPTPVQEQAWQTIATGAHTLIASPTGSGKTLAALLPCIEQLLTPREATCEAEIPRGVRVLYITPLKALNNDIEHHVFDYLRQMEDTAAALGRPWPKLTVAVRTGDTTSAQRTSMLRQPPDLLITTPESFHLLMTAEKGRQILRTVEQIIVDEIHDLAADRRGAHLSLTLERHAALCGRAAQRIGVSATQKPLERVARFLAGWEQGQSATPRPVAILENRADKRLELRVEVPELMLAQGPSVAGDRETWWLPLVQRISAALATATTALIFVNNRRLCERLALRLNDHHGYEIARSHHSSVSKEQRLEVEQLLKQGQLRCLVATSSLELGIDVGHIDLVLQIDSPKQTASGLQRFGRAGHHVDGLSKGVVLVKNQAELVEAAVLARTIRERDLEDIRLPIGSLDVLAQSVTAMVATEDLYVEDVLRIVRGSDLYRTFPRAKLDAMLAVLSGFYPFAKPLLTWHVDRDLLQRRSNTQMSALLGAGTIPHSANYPVVHGETGVRVGELDEEFVHESRAGDVFHLGTSSWMIQSIRHDRVVVAETSNRFSEIPFWRGEGAGRSRELGAKLGQFLEQVQAVMARSEAEAEVWLADDYCLSLEAAAELLRLVRRQQEKSAVPTHRRFVIEHFVDPGHQHHLLLLSPFGKRLHRTWMLALERCFQEEVPVPFECFAKDDGIQFVFSTWDPSWPDLLGRVTTANARELLAEAIPSSPLFAITFRRLAETSLLLSHGYTRTPMWHMRMRSEELLRDALAYAAQFPLIEETLHECLHEHLDLDGLLAVLRQIEAGEIALVHRECAGQTPFARSFHMPFYESKLYADDTLSPDLQVSVAALGKGVVAASFGPDTRELEFDPDALAREQQRFTTLARPLRDAEGLYRLLKERGDLTESELEALVGAAAVPYLAELLAAQRVVPVVMAGETRYICRDERDLYAAFPTESFAVQLILDRWRDTRVSFTEQALQQRYDLSPAHTRSLLDEWVAGEAIAEAVFAEPEADGGRPYSSRKILARLVRTTLQTRRRQQPALEGDTLLRAMVDLHQLAPQRRRTGVEGLRAVIEQLQGLFLPVADWEALIFPARLQRYQKQDLDLLCASGEVCWIGRGGVRQKEPQVAFFLSESKALYTPYLLPADESSDQALLDLLRQRGASFLTTLNRELGGLPTEVLERLLQQVWAGQVANDQFAPLRNMTAKAKSKTKGLAVGIGRWHLLDQTLEREAAAEAIALQTIQQLLKRYPVLGKQMLGEGSPFTWPKLLPVLERLEEWGTLVRGLFLRDLPSMQFTLPEHVQRLHRARAEEATEDDVLVLAAVDPANPYGVVLDWPKQEGVPFARKAGHYLVLHRGRWVLYIESKGKRMHVLDPELQQQLDDGETGALDFLRQTFRDLLRLQGGVKIKLETWNRTPILQTALNPHLQALGADRDRAALVFWSGF